MPSYVDKVPQFPCPLGGMITFAITERCNNNCAHCCINLPADCRQALDNELTADEVLAIAEQAASLGCLTVRFTGGEPLLRDDLPHIYRSTRRMGMKVLLFTNATLITPELADMFARIPPLREIEVTLYGMSPRSYESVSRTPGSFHAAWNGIQLLLERKVPVHIKGALLPSNVAEIDEFERWAASIPGMNKPPIQAMNFFLRCRRDDMAKNETIRSVRVSPDDTVMAGRRHEDDYFKTQAMFASKFLEPPGEKLFTCGLGTCVDPYGVLYPCTNVRFPEAGYDLRSGSLKDAIDHFQPRLARLVAKNPEYLNRCAVCFLEGLCEQCPAASWAEHGNPDTPVDYLCEVAHAQARYLGLLDDNEHGWEVTDWKDRIASLKKRLALEDSSGGTDHGSTC